MDLYTWHTPNGKKVPILLAELGWSYRLHCVDLGKDEQKAPTFLELNPNGKIPAFVDGHVTIFESGAILQYLADKASRFLPRSGAPRWEVLSWLYWQVGGVGPMFGQMGSFARQAPRDHEAYGKFFVESKRLARVLESKLDRDYIAGAYSIADIAAYPWFAGALELAPEILVGCERVTAWMERMASRPAVKRGMALEVPVQAEHRAQLHH